MAYIVLFITFFPKVFVRLKKNINFILDIPNISINPYSIVSKLYMISLDIETLVFVNTNDNYYIVLNLLVPN